MTNILKANDPAKVIKIIVWAAILLATRAFAGFGEDKPAPAVTAGKAFKLSGYTQILGTIQESGVDSAAVRRARFSLAGEIIKNLKAKFTIDVVRSPVLIDAQLDATFSEALNLRFGQFLVPFGVESSVSTADLDTINRSQPVDKLAPGRDIGTLGRDVGLALTGKYSLFDYTVGVFNGTGANKADTNDKKDFAGRLGIRPLEFLSVGASLYKGSYNTAVGAPSTRRDRTGIDAALIVGDVSVKGEFIWAVDDRIDKRGWFVQGGLFVLPKTIQVLAKFDAFDKDASAANDRTNLYTLGLNWFFADRTKIQVNYEYLRNESGRMANQSLLVQFQAGF
jgi:phosphate-selective porin OprO and OprP